MALLKNSAPPYPPLHRDGRRSTSKDLSFSTWNNLALDLLPPRQLARNRKIRGLSQPASGGEAIWGGEGVMGGLTHGSVGKPTAKEGFELRCLRLGARSLGFRLFG